MRYTTIISCLVILLGTFATAQTQDAQGQDQSAVSVVPATSDESVPSTAKAPKKVKHVYTSDDMKPADPNDTPSQAAASSLSDATTSATSAPGAPAKDKTVTKATKAKKAGPEAIATAQAKVDDLKKQVDGTSGAVQDLQRLIDEEPSRAENMGPGLAMQQSNLADAKKKLADAQKELDDLKSAK